MDSKIKFKQFLKSFHNSEVALKLLYKNANNLLVVQYYTE